jgi:hypothetical protein
LLTTRNLFIDLAKELFCACGAYAPPSTVGCYSSSSAFAQQKRVLLRAAQKKVERVAVDIAWPMPHKRRGMQCNK